MGLLKYFFVFLFLLMIDVKVQAVEFSMPQIPDQVFEIFHKKIRPAVMTTYKIYRQTYGEQISETLLQSYDYLAPKTSQTYHNAKNYLYNVNPKFYDEMGRLPAPVKRAHEELLYAIWGTLYTTLEMPRGTPRPTPLENFQQEGLNIFKARTGLIKAPADVQKRMEMLLNQVRPYSLDKGMTSCFKIYAVPINYETLFNTGCHIYVFKGMYDGYTDGQLRATIAHEMSHGINGDSLKRFAYLTKAAIYHISKLSMEELAWVTTDEEMQYMSDTFEHGHMAVFNQAYNKDLQFHELRADKMGVQMLNAAGFSGNDALSALYLSEGVKPGKEKIEKNEYDSAHPPLYLRLKIVRQNMRF